MIESDERGRNFGKRGGINEAKSPEKAIQERREATTLMVVHTSASDIPPSPREPPASAFEETLNSVVTLFGEPDKPYVRVSLASQNSFLLRELCF